MKKVQLAIFLLFCLAFCLNAASPEKKRNVNLVFIGNSITQGVIIPSPEQNAPPVKAAAYLRQQPGIGTVQFANCGVSGCTTLDYLPASENLFPRAKEAADKFSRDKNALLVFSIMLGTNDSAVKGPHGAPVAPKQYQTNLGVIIDRLLSLYPGCRVVIHRPIWYSANTYNGSMYLAEGQKRLQSYFPEIDMLVAQYAESHPQQVWPGDCEAYAFFEKNHQTDLIPEQGNAGTFYLHPNVEGAGKLGAFWGKAILPALK